jgi:DNA-binding transcriptional LysR family regulator
LVTFSPTLPIGEVVAAAFREAGLRHAITMEVGQSFVACALARAGAAVALVDELIMCSRCFPDLVVRPFHPAREIPVVLLMPRRQEPSLLAAAFEAELRR